MNTIIKSWLITGVLVLSSSLSFASACDESPEAMNGYMNSILKQVEKSSSSAQVKKNIAAPLTCLLKIYRDSSGITKYLAAACLRPFLGGKEIVEIKKDHRHDKLLKHLIDSALDQDDPLRDPVLGTYSAGRWEEYLPFCKDSASQELCLILFPDTNAILKQGDFLGASSMLLLKEAFQKFDEGAPKEQMARQIRQLYREVPKSERLKRRVIDRIYEELFGKPLGLGLA